MRAKLLAPLLMLLLITACSTGGVEDSEAAIRYPTMDNNNVRTDIPSLDCNFRGVWTVDGVTTDTVDANVLTNRKQYGGKNYVAFLGFPFETIAKKAISGIEIAKITNTTSDGGPLPEDEALFLQAIIDHGDGYNCMETYVSKEFRLIGFSESTIYLELMPGPDYSVLYLPFVVTTTQGEMFSVTAAIAPTMSTATIDSKGETFSCVLTVPKVEVKRGEELVVNKMEPELKMKYTSIKRVEYATVGN